MGRAALKIAGRGVPVAPLCPVRRVAYPGFPLHLASAEAAVVEHAWLSRPGAAIVTPTGPEAGLWALCVARAGRDAFEAARAKCFDFDAPEMAGADSLGPTGDLTLLFKWPEDGDAPSDGPSPIWRGVEIAAAPSRYVLLAPSALVWRDLFAPGGVGWALWRASARADITEAPPWLRLWLTRPEAAGAACAGR